MTSHYFWLVSGKTATDPIKKGIIANPVTNLIYIFNRENSLKGDRYITNGSLPMGDTGRVHHQLL
jgi:hypothetical protein